MRHIALLVLFAAAPAASQPAPPTANVPSLEFAFSEHVTLGEPIKVGKTGLGDRNIVPITGGTFEGPGIKGTIIPGGWDWQLARPDGCLQIKADYMLKTDDGAVINVINQGLFCRSPNGAPSLPRTVAMFEPPVGKYEWLGKSAFVGTIEPAGAGGGINIRFYRVK